MGAVVGRAAGGAALASCPVVVPRWASEDLLAGIEGLARRWEELDSWAGRVGDAVAAADVFLGGGAAAGPVDVAFAGASVGAVADRPSWVDALADDEADQQVLALAERLRGIAPFVQGGDRRRLREELAPLVARVQRRWPAASFVNPKECRPVPTPPKGVQDALDLLRLPGEGRPVRTASVAKAFGVGLLAGKPEDGEAYDDLAPEVARTVGHVLSGLLVYGDLRDAAEESAKDNWRGAALAMAGLVPAFGDAAKGGHAFEELAARADELRDASEALDGVRDVQNLRLSQLFEGRTPRASELRDWGEAQGWTFRETPTGPPTFIDENGIKRMQIKRGSARTPGSEMPHISLRDASGRYMDPWGRPVTRQSPGNHVLIEWDLEP